MLQSPFLTHTHIHTQRLNDENISIFSNVIFGLETYTTVSTAVVIILFRNDFKYLNCDYLPTGETKMNIDIGESTVMDVYLRLE